MDERVLRGVLNQDWQSGAKEINRAFREAFPNIFWSRSADTVVDTIRATADLNVLYGLMNLSMAVEFHALKDIDPSKSPEWQDPEAHRADPRNDYFGRTYSAMAYFGHVSRAQIAALNPKSALKCEEVMLNKVLEYLDLRGSEVPASLLSGRLKLEQVSTKAELLGTTELRELVKKTGFFDAAKELNRLSPKFWKVSWNGLSIASKLQESEHYQEFLDHLVRSRSSRASTTFARETPSIPILTISTDGCRKATLHRSSIPTKPRRPTMRKVMYVVIAAWVSIAPAAQSVNLETGVKQEMALRKVGTETLT